jgi:nucleotide-binding universal stress UspA family protein
MLPLKKILLPTDFSEPSYEALKIAKEMAMHFSAELFFMHVVPPLPPFAPPPKDKPSFNVMAYVKNLHLSAEKSLQEVIDKKIGNKLKAHISVAHGDVAEKVARHAHKENIDLIIIASHGTTGWKKTFLGSVTEKLVRISTVSTLIIPKPLEKNKQK